MFPLLKYSEDEVNAYYAKVTPAMVQASLEKDRHDWFDLLNLLSPAAASALPLATPVIPA